MLYNELMELKKKKVNERNQRIEDCKFMFREFLRSKMIEELDNSCTKSDYYVQYTLDGATKHNMEEMKEAVEKAMSEDGFQNYVVILYPADIKDPCMNKSYLAISFDLV